jgi:protein TonB
MSSGVQPYWREDFDQPWRRLPWIILGALIAWIVLLSAFARMLEEHAPPPPPPEPIEARIVELPPPTAGLQGGGAPASAGPITHHPAAPKPKPLPIVKPPPTIHHHVKKTVRRNPMAIVPPSPFGTARHIEHPEPVAPPIASKGPAGGATEHGGASVSSSGNGSGGVAGGTGSGSAAGLGSDSSGARAMYAPKPTIPDDMRENPFSTVAVARFIVSPEGEVDVTLIKPTPNPRLNQILLDTLKQWKFFPAMRNGVAINSEFEVRIPIAVQ